MNEDLVRPLKAILTAGVKPQCVPTLSGVRKISVEARDCSLKSCFL